MKCVICRKLLEWNDDGGKHIEGHYVYGEENYCLDCWEKREINKIKAVDSPK